MYIGDPGSEEIVPVPNVDGKTNLGCKKILTACETFGNHETRRGGYLTNRESESEISLTHVLNRHIGPVDTSSKCDF